MDSNEIKQQLNARLEELLDAYFPNWVRDGQVARPLPASKTDKGSMWVNLRGPKRGGWCRPSTGDSGDEISLIAYALNSDTNCDASIFTECLKFLGSEPTPVKRTESKAKPEKKFDPAKIISSTKPIEGTLAEKYLNSRGIYLDELPIVNWPQCLKFHENLPHSQGESYPALISVVNDRNMNPIGLIRTYLKPDGSGKAPVDSPKKMLGNMAGGAVMLSDTRDYVCVTEGIENALSVMQMFKKPCWALGSTSNQNWLPPEKINTVRIYGDGDSYRRRNGKIMAPPGRKFSESLRENLNKKGITAIIQPPPKEGDWNDFLNRR